MGKITSKKIIKSSGLKYLDNKCLKARNNTSFNLIEKMVFIILLVANSL